MDIPDVFIGSTDDGHTFVVLNRRLREADRLLTDAGFLAREHLGRKLYLLPPGSAQDAHERAGVAVYGLLAHTHDLIDRESILTGAAADGEQPWKYYDLGDGSCSYDFFAKCPHRLACARCPFYVPKESTRGRLLEVKNGIEQMLEQLDLTDDERQALEGDRDAVTALTQRLADIPTPAGPTPTELGTDAAFIPLTQLLGTAGRRMSSGVVATEVPKDRRGTMERKQSNG
ncbi:hypothetical protein AB0D74_23405 [Streptomyces sp. NPDC048278]|uniref:hypothetical protein n=1 Tax=Streptomyces sp. NPDC048278 TaxID=3155809 RepID=UPI003417875F